MKHGAVPVVIESRRGQRFQVDVLRRDRHPQAKAGVGETRLYALYLANNGRGSKPTQEEQGVGLLWLAAMLRPREGRVRPGMLLTQRERVRMFPRGRFRWCSIHGGPATARPRGARLGAEHPRRASVPGRLRRPRRVRSTV
ncbi:MAG: hypothetical protein IPN17_32630 [Deltaproteobacteria bacterium]|nr:hypothetical protein [Deltaproteobacteria bacterium]